MQDTQPPMHHVPFSSTAPAPWVSEPVTDNNLDLRIKAFASATALHNQGRTKLSNAINMRFIVFTALYEVRRIMARGNKPVGIMYYEDEMKRQKLTGR